MTGRIIGLILIAILAITVASGDRLAPNGAMEQFADRAWAPPMALRGLPTNLYVHPLRLEDRLERRYVMDDGQRLQVEWFSHGRLLASASTADPVLLLGADPLGRDIFARVTGAARWSLGVAITGALGGVALGLLFGALAASGNATLDRVITACGNTVAALPAIYIVLILRASLPLVISPAHVFCALAVFMAGIGWPAPARGVRGIFMTERELDYAHAATAAGASRMRLFFVHLLPAASGFLLTQFLVMVPGFLLAEVTLSFLGLGFPEPTPSWGTMLQDAANVRVIAEAPWMLAPAGAIAITSIAMHLAAGGGRDQLTVFSRPR